ncbi:MPN domain-containing protein isoform X2 [Sipha flava]|uniref:MPN domain-containing protein isoform X2 n=2 Tax=Sipha flava TaxID=143950 RepID=A0A8B8GR31_9HEMI|nr:MPN domain-containing protein isoform X2 [Sipha flava]
MVNGCEMNGGAATAVVVAAVEPSTSARSKRRVRGNTSRTVTLQMLLDTRILEPGDSVLSLEYMGQRFEGDLLPDGKIRSVETLNEYASPSAWAYNCKSIINKIKKAGCGWSSIRYKGKKLDAYKHAYFRKRESSNVESIKHNTIQEDMESNDMKYKTQNEILPSTSPNDSSIAKEPIKFSEIRSRSSNQNLNTLVECTNWSYINKVQPFYVNISANATLLLDFHCHLTSSEVVGYLAGYWDFPTQTLTIKNAYPFRSRLHDTELTSLIEEEIRNTFTAKNMVLVGWYHSHPETIATPTLKDIEAQLDYEVQIKGPTVESYIPCVGIICSPYDKGKSTFDSTITCYWVLPSFENEIHNYGRPMNMNFTTKPEKSLSLDIVMALKKCVDFNKYDPDFINFKNKYKNDVTYLEKLKISLTDKFPEDDTIHKSLWNFLSEIVCTGSSGDSAKNNLQHLISIISSRQLLLSTSCFQTHSSLSEHLESHLKSCNANNLASNEMPTTSDASKITSESIASSLFNDLDFSKAMSLIGLSPSRYQTNPLK